MNLVDLHNKHKGQVIGIIGNGPSLNDVEQQEIASDCDTWIGVHYAWKRKGMTLPYWLCLDQNPLIEWREDCNELIGCKIIRSGIHGEDIADVLVHHLPWDKSMRICHGMETREYCATGRFPVQNLEPTELSKLKGGILAMKDSSVFAALHLALIMGPFRIRLYGVDCSVTQDRFDLDTNTEGHRRKMAEHKIQLDQFWRDWHDDVSMINTSPIYDGKWRSD